MHPVTISHGPTGYEETDQLDGKNITNDEPLDVRWPNGVVVRHRAIVEKTMIPYTDMGHTYKMPVSRAYVEITYNGATVRVRLINAGTAARRPLQTDPPVKA